MLVLGTQARAQEEHKIEGDYRFEMAVKSTYLIGIRKNFGDILESGNLKESFLASKAAVDALDEIKLELQKMEVPDRMKEPHRIFLKSVNSYRKSAACIRNATEILLGYHDGTPSEANELMQKGGNYVEIANEHFDRSLNMHEKLIQSDKFIRFDREDSEEKYTEERKEQDESDKSVPDKNERTSI